MRGTGPAVRAQRAWLSGRDLWHRRSNQDAISQICQFASLPSRTLHLLRDGNLDCSCHFSSRVRKLRHPSENPLERNCCVPSASLSALNTGTVQQRHCCISPSSRNQGQDCCSFVQRSAVLLTQPEWSLPNERPRARFFWSTVGSCVGPDSSSGRHRSKSGCDCPAEVVRT